MPPPPPLIVVVVVVTVLIPVLLLILSVSEISSQLNISIAGRPTHVYLRQASLENSWLLQVLNMYEDRMKMKAPNGKGRVASGLLKTYLLYTSI